MTGVAHPVHHPKHMEIKVGLAEVILDDHPSFCQPFCLAEQRFRLSTVMQHIHEHHHVEGIGRKRYLDSIEPGHRYVRVGTHVHVETRHMQRGSLFEDGSGEPAVTTSHIEHRAVRRKQPQEAVAQHSHTPSVDVATVKRLEQAIDHRG